jgi:hypothetical protein
MTTSSPEPTVSSRQRRRATPARATREEVLAVAERAARIADGFVLLERAPLECVAVLLAVDPRTIERVRLTLEDPSLREEAAERWRACAHRPAPREPAPPPAPSSPEELLALARQRPDGLPMVLGAAPEAAAVAFGVHPELVLRAREAAARAGLRGDPSPA